MLLRKPRIINPIPRSSSKQKVQNSRSLVKVASSSKLPKDFFQKQSYETKSNMTKSTQSFQFTFMGPLMRNICTAGLKKTSKQVKRKQKLVINRPSTQQKSRKT